MEFSSYQKNVFSWVENSFDQYGAVDSVAGSGKTFTGVKSMEHVPQSKNILYTCFNKDNKTDIQEKCKHIFNATADNYNSIGFAICRKYQRRIELQKNKKTEMILKYKILGAQTGGNLKDDDLKIYYKYKNTFTRIVSLLKGMCVYNVKQAFDALPGIFDFHDFDLPEDDDKLLPFTRFVDLLTKTFDLSINQRYYMDYDDQVYQPLLNDWDGPKYDFIMVDEYQDTNEMQAQLMKRTLKPGGRMMVFGDDDQCIYEFRGALPNTMGKWAAEHGATKLPLSICYRCPKSVVREAQKIVPRIEYAENAIEGVVDEIKTQKMMDMLRDGDFILCRTNAPLVKRCLKLMKMGRKATVRGRDVGDMLVGVINSIQQDDGTIPDFLIKLKDYRDSKVEKWLAQDKDDKVDELDDKLSMIRAVAEESSTVEECRVKLGNMFSDDSRPGIQLMSSHKSKGLQNPRVFVEEPGQLADDWRSKKPWHPASQRRLRYVTNTRAQEELYFVRDK